MIRVVSEPGNVRAYIVWGAKACKIGEKGVFLVMFTNFGKDMVEKIKKNIQNTYLGSSFISRNTFLGCVLNFLFKDDI